jgi:AraC-like DNA-binding protein
LAPLRVQDDDRPCRDGGVATQCRRYPQSAAICTREWLQIANRKAPAAREESMEVASTALASRRIFHSRDPDETRAFLESKQFRLDYPNEAPTDVDAYINGVYLPGSYLGSFYYGHATRTVATPLRTDFWVQIPLRGAFELQQGGDKVRCDDAAGALLSPAHQNTIRSQPDCERLVMSLTGSTVTRQLAALLDRPLPAPIEFAARLDTAHGYGLSIARYLRTTAIDLENDDALLRNPLAMSLFEQFIVGALLLSHAHNYSALLHRPQPAVHPRDVRRAIDYIRAHLDAPVTLADIIAASGAPGRTLFNHFRRFTGLSPLGYLRNARFDQVRRVLRDPHRSESIASVAARYGFDHPGRFAAEYRKRFGVAPSSDARRSREASCESS